MKEKEEMKEKVLSELIKTRNVLKRKLRAIKVGETDAKDQWEETFKPITDPLNQFLDISKRLKIEKEEIKNEDYSGFTPNKLSLNMKTSTPNENIYKRDIKKIDEKYDDANDEFFSQSETSVDYENNTIDLSRLKKQNKLDIVYGPNQDSRGNWKFANNNMQLTKDKVVIGNQNWALTPGLFELLFLKSPNNYDDFDLTIYQKILENTNAHRRNYNSESQIKGTKGVKYNNVIRKLFSNFKGSGLMKLNSNVPNYIYWDDPNELIDRLRLLIASQAAGHNNHNNEIISIIEELKEADIIL